MKAIFALILGIFFFVLSQTTFYSKTYLSITTNDSVLEYQLSLIDEQQNKQVFSQKPPLEYPFFYIFDDNYVDTYQPLLGYFTAYFSLPTHQLFQNAKITLISTLPIDIKSICLHNTFKEKCWNTQELPLHFETISSQHETTLQYKNDFQVLQQQFLIPHLAQKTLIFIFAMLLICVLYYLYLQRERLYFSTAPQAIFLWFGIIFGVLTCFINPLFEVPDEIYHLSHAFHLTQSLENNPINRQPTNAIISAAELHLHYRHTPYLAKEKLRYFSQLPLHLQSTLQTHYTKHHSMFPYVVSSIGIYIGKTLEFSWINTLYLARITNLLFWLLCGYLAIRVIPFGKWLLCLIALSPMSLFQAASVSLDSFTNGLSFLLIALILSLVTIEKKHTLTLFFIFITIILLALSKIPYLVLICLLFLLLTQHKIKLDYCISNIIVVMVLLVSLLWFSFNQISSNFLSLTQQQLQEIIQQPTIYFQLILETIKGQGVLLIEEWVGRLGWLEIPLPMWFVMVHLSALVIYALTDSNYPLKLNLLSKFLILFVFALGILVVFTTLYIIETPLLKLPYIDGLQGRYFIPLGILPFLLLQNRLFYFSNKVLVILSTVYLSFSLIFMLIMISKHYH
ncbi:MAG: hypothetical protein RIT27_67 [Pseudomonadota bacterium]|jgi:uncharacterized membrane protein